MHIAAGMGKPRSIATKGTGEREGGRKLGREGERERR
jgi:hypothetical protein